MTAQPLRIGLVGAGGNQRLRHVPGFQAIDGVEVVSLCNRTPESGQRFADEFGIPTVAPSVEAVINDPNVGAISIGTWPYKHREYTIAALEAGKHVLCEARMAMNADEAEDMLSASEAHPNLVAQLVPAPFDFQLGPTIQRLVGEGSLGDILEVDVTLRNGGGLDRSRTIAWRDRASLSGHNTMMMGILSELVLRWLGETTRVIAHARTFVTERPDEEGNTETISIPDSLSIAGDMACGARVSYSMSTMAQGAPFNGITLFGAKGTLRWTMGDTAEMAAHGQPFQLITADAGTNRGWQVEQDFIRSIREDAPVELTSFRDGVRYMRFTDAVWKSWNEGVAVDIQTLP